MKKTLFQRDFTQYPHKKKSIISINTIVHTDNHVFYVYLGINDTKVKQICKLTDTNTVTALIMCFILENNSFMPDSFKPDVVGTPLVLNVKTSSISCVMFKLGGNENVNLG